MKVSLTLGLLGLYCLFCRIQHLKQYGQGWDSQNFSTPGLLLYSVLVK